MNVPPRPNNRVRLATSRGSEDCQPAPRHRGWPAATPPPCSSLLGARWTGAGGRRSRLAAAGDRWRARIWPDDREPGGQPRRAGRAVEALAGRLGLARPSEASWACWPRQRRLGALPAIIDEFARQLAAHRGEETAQVTSAVALDEAQLGSRARRGRRLCGPAGAADRRGRPGAARRPRRADRLAHGRCVAEDQAAAISSCP